MCDNALPVWRGEGTIQDEIGGKRAKQSQKSSTRKEYEEEVNSIAGWGQGGLPPCGVWGRRPLWGLGNPPNRCSSKLLKGNSQQGAGSEASLPVTKKPSNTVQVTWEATAEGVQRAIGKPSGSYSFYHYNRKVNSGSAKSSLTFYCCRGISRLRARPKGMKTNEVCDRPLETFGAHPCFWAFIAA